MTLRDPRVPIAAAVALLAGACAPAERADRDAADPAAATTAAPDTTGAALWAHLEAAPYTSWAMWPGRAALYPGTEPHGMLLTTYVNRLGLDAINTGAGSMPVGAIVVKENYMPDSTLAAVTVMYKAAGYAPDAGNWFWVKRNADGTIEAEGRVPMCQGCHASQAGNDYLFTGPLRAGGGGR